MKNSKLFWLYLLSASIYFTQGIEGIASLPFIFYLKNNLHFTPEQVMFWTSWITLAWVIKPIIGYFIDSFLNKKVWILISLVGSLFFATNLGLIAYLPIFWLVLLMGLASTNTAVRDIAIDGLSVQEGKKESITGRLQSIQWGALTIASIITGFIGGYISEHYTYQFAYLCLIPFYVLMLVIVSKYKIESIQNQKDNIFKIIKRLFTDKHLMLVCLFLFLYKFSPAFGTPLMYIMQDKFHWSQTFIGTLDTISAIFSLLGALIYWHFSKKINLNQYLTWSVFLGACLTLCYLIYIPVTAIIYAILFSIIGMMINLLVLDFMAQNTLEGLESISFALLCSVSNFASTCNGFSGSYLLPIVGLQWLIIISAITSFSCLFIIPYLRKF